MLRLEYARRCLTCVQLHTLVGPARRRQDSCLAATGHPAAHRAIGSFAGSRYVGFEARAKYLAAQLGAAVDPHLSNSAQIRCCAQRRCDTFLW